MLLNTPVSPHAIKLAKEWSAQILNMIHHQMDEASHYATVICDLEDAHGVRIAARLLFCTGIPHDEAADVIRQSKVSCRDAGLWPALVMYQARKAIAGLFSPDMIDWEGMFDAVDESTLAVAVVTGGSVAVMKLLPE